MAVKLANKEAALDQFQELLQGLPLDRWQQSKVMANFKSLPAKQIQRHAQSIIEALMGLADASTKFRALKAKLGKTKSLGKVTVYLSSKEPDLVAAQGAVMSELEQLTKTVKSSPGKK
jgi:hypothetical protein